MPGSLTGHRCQPRRILLHARAPAAYEDLSHSLKHGQCTIAPQVAAHDERNTMANPEDHSHRAAIAFRYPDVDFQDAKKQQRVHPPTYRRIQLALVVLAALAATTAGTFVDVVLGGRLPPKLGVTGGVASTALGAQASHAAKFSLLLIPVTIIALNTRVRHTNTGALFALFTTVIGAQLVNRIDLHHWQLTNHFWMFIVIGIALWSIGLQWSDLEVIGYIVGILALLTLAMTVVTSHAWMYGDAQSIADTKALLGSKILAGPFSQMNNLGMSMAAGFPFVLLIRHKGWRTILLVTVLLACVLSASRTSLIALCVTVVAFIVLTACRTPKHRKRATLAGLTALAAAVVWIPLVTSNPGAYTSRGEIWMKSITLWTSNWTTGSSTFAYVGDGAVADVIGRSTYHGHNLFVTIVTMGGVLLTVCCVPLLVAVMSRTVNTLNHSIVPALFIVIIASMSITEMPLRFDDFTGASWITWTALLSIALFTRDSAEPEPVGPEEPEELQVSPRIAPKLGPRW